MPVSDKDRKDYEEGRKDRKSGIVPQFARDIMPGKPGSEAYQKGREGKPLDDDKQDKKK